MKPFFLPRRVVNKQTGDSFGVFDGARVFGHKYYALLKDGVVKLYDHRNRQLYEDCELEDVWVAPNGYRLIKRKASECWELWNLVGDCVEGERAAVFQQENICLVFLKLKEASRWCFYNVNKSSMMPSARYIDTEDVDVRYEKLASGCNRLMFILTSGGKVTLQRINMLFLKPEDEIRNVAYHEFLPDGSIVVADDLLTRTEARCSVQVMPSSGCKMTVYTPDLKSQFCSDGIVMFQSGVFLQLDDSHWRVYDATCRPIGSKIYDVKIYFGLMSYDIGIQGRTADGLLVKIVARSAKEIFLEYADKRIYIIDGKMIVYANATEDVFLI